MLNLGEHLRGTRPTRAIFTTFALSPSLFDSHLVRRLLENGCEEILLLTDRAGYEALLAERGAISYAGCSYWVCRIDVSPFVFHPKVALLWSPNEASLYVMSSNLTHGGLWRNAEIVDRLVWNQQTGGPASEIRRAAEWCERLPEALALPVAIRRPLTRMLGELKAMLPAAGAVEGTKDQAVRFIHNLDEPLLPQILKAAPDTVDEVLVAAPFYGPGLEPLASIAERFPKAKITAAQESSTGTIDPSSVSSRLRQRIKVATCKLTGPVRPWHAKFILLKGSAEWLFASGSANMTSAALLGTVGDGNVEAAVVRVGDRTNIAGLVDQLRMTPASWNALRFKPISSDSGKAGGPIVRWAEIVGLRLKVEIRGVDPDDTAPVRGLTLHLRTGARDSLAHKTTQLEAGGLALEAPLPRDIDADLGSSIFASLDARSSDRTPYSRLRVLVMCPDEISAPVAMRRFRAAVRAIQRQEMHTDDVREVLTFVRHNLSGLLLHLRSQSGFHHVGRPKDDPKSFPDRPAVTLVDEEHSTLLRGFPLGDAAAGLLGDLPALFRNLLQPEARTASPGRPSGGGGLERDDDSEDEEFEDPPEYDLDALAEDVRRFLDWVRDSFDADPIDDEDAVRQWPVRSQLIEFASVFARFYYISAEQSADPESLRLREYLNRILSLLAPAVSAAGLAFGRPGGWFVRAKQLDRAGRCKASTSLTAQVLFQLSELLSVPGATAGAQLSVSPLLEGLDLISGGPAEASDEVRSALIALLASYRQPDTRFDEVVKAARAVRSIVTPERQALAKFGLLLSLQKAVGVVAALTSGHPSGAAPDQDLLAAAAKQRDLRGECERLFPSETLEYISLTMKGKWDNFVPIRPKASNACPRCNMSFPVRLATSLKNILRITQCPSCLALIIPIPMAPPNDFRHEHS